MAVKLVLSQYSRKTDNRKSIQVSIRKGEKRKVVKTGFYAHTSEWSDKSQNVRKAHPAYNELQTELKRIRLHFENELINDQIDEFKSNSLMERNGLKGEKAVFQDYAEVQIDQLLSIGKIGNARTYKIALKQFTDFAGRIQFSEIRPDLLMSFKDKKFQEGCNENTIHNYLRTLRAIWNRAELELPSPFQSKYLFPRQKPTAPKALSIQDVRLLWEFQPSHREKQMALALDAWKLGFLFRGLDLVDVAHLKKTQLSGTHFDIARQKSSSRLTIKIVDEARTILRKYNNEPWVLPILTNHPERSEQYRIYINKRTNLNRSLSTIGQSLELSRPLTSKTCRYTFINLAKVAGIEKGIIKELVGHEDRTVTDIYLEAYPQEIIDQAHETTIQKVLSY